MATVAVLAIAYEAKPEIKAKNDKIKIHYFSLAQNAEIKTGETKAPTMGNEQTSQISRSQLKSGKKFIVGIAPGIALTMGDWISVYSLGFGGDLRTNYKLAEKIFLSGNASIFFFSGKYENKIFRIQPIMGIQYRHPFTANVDLVGGTGFGVTIDNWSRRSLSDTETAITFEICAGIGLGFFDILPRLRFVSHEGESFHSFDLAISFNLRL
jgi:hypothetical protein